MPDPSIRSWQWFNQNRGAGKIPAPSFWYRQIVVEFSVSICYNTHTLQGSYIGYYSGFPSLGGGFDSRTLLQIKKRCVSTSFLFGHKEGNRTHLNAGVRWTPAGTSSKTGAYLYFLSPLGERKCKSIPVSYFYTAQCLTSSAVGTAELLL